MQARGIFGGKLRATVFEAATMREVNTPANACWLSKFLAMLCMGAPDPVQKNTVAMAKALMTCLSAWWQRLETNSAAFTLGEDEAGTHSAAGPNLATQPQYSIFFVLFLLAQHCDCPTPEDVRTLPANAEDRDDEVCHRLPSRRSCNTFRRSPPDARCACRKQTSRRRWMASRQCCTSTSRRSSRRPRSRSDRASSCTCAASRARRAS